MFTGIIQAIGQIAAIELKGLDSRFYIKTGSLDLSDVAIGDSIAANGICLTAVVLPGDGF
ncbi:MAG: riboflavin synthase, partial [Gammaproteobacteria bacterium]|nr:riboflavin synthase [Gammaproteobacteria bacterium]